MPTSHKRCLCCKDYFRTESMVRHPAGWFKDNDHAITYVRRKQAKESKREHVEKVRNFRMKDRSHQLELTQGAVNKLAKLLDKDSPCIVHGRHTCADGLWDAGHFLTRAAHPELRFDLRNIFKQCRGSNVAVQWRGRGKNTEASIRQQFEAGIVQQFGYKHLEWLLGPHPVAKWAIEDLIKIRLDAKAEIRRIEQGLGPSRDWRACNRG